MASKKKEIVEEAVLSIDLDNPENVEILDDETDINQDLTLDPKMDDPAWTTWVLGQFESSELEDGLPKVDGLRRLVRKLVGPIIKGKAKTRQAPTIENEQRATVEYTVRVLNKYQLYDYEEPYIVEFTDVADAYRGNIKGLEYARFPTAMAATRAEARALRKVLNLGIVASDEISDQPLEEAGFTGKISESQITKIDIKCQQLDIDVIKFINMGKVKYNSVENVSNNTAIKMFGLINEYQQEVKPIPESIIGYKPNWRGEF